MFEGVSHACILDFIIALYLFGLCVKLIALNLDSLRPFAVIECQSDKELDVYVGMQSSIIHILGHVI